MMSRLRQVFSCLLIAPAVLPLVYISGVLYPYVTPKTFLLQGFGIIALAMFAYLAFAGQVFYYNRLRTLAAWIPALLLAVAFGTSFFGIDFYHSFWGLFERGDGLLTLTVITGFFYLILLSAPTPSGVGVPTSDVGADTGFFNRFAKLVTIVAGIVASIAILQWVMIALGGRVGFLPPVTGRIGSTFGNAAFLAGYLGMALFVTLIAFRQASGFWRTVFLSSAGMSILAILLAATRGTILALLLAGGVALTFAAWKGGEKARRSARYGLAAFVILAGSFFIFRTELAQSSFMPVQRLASISLADSTVSSRLFVWSNVAKEALKRPFSGYGAEHVAQLFDKVYDPSEIVEQWFDRSHNAFLDYFAQYGVFGFALYLALIVAFAVSAFRLYRRESPGVMNAGFLFLLLILTYAVQNFFVFDTPSSLWLLYALFAMLLVLSSPTKARALFPRRVPVAISAGAFALIALCIIPAVVLPFSANLSLSRGYRYHLIDANRANAYFERGLALGTYADLEYGYQAYEMYTSRQAVALAGEDRIAAYGYALSILKANLEKYPYDARTATYLGHVLDTAPPEVSVDDAFSEQVLKRAIELSPLRAQAWYMLANIALRKADALPQDDAGRERWYREAIAILEAYAQKEPKLPVPRYTLATLYYKLGDRAAAKKWADEGFFVYVNPDIAVAKPAVKYYLAIQDWRNAARFLADLVSDNPADYDVLYDLAKVTYLAGDPAAALRIVDKLRAERPEILATDPNFLAAITAYEQSAR